jgi:hypothetical protein
MGQHGCFIELEQVFHSGSFNSEGIHFVKIELVFHY